MALARPAAAAAARACRRSTGAATRDARDGDALRPVACTAGAAEPCSVLDSGPVKRYQRVHDAACGNRDDMAYVGTYVVARRMTPL